MILNKNTGYESTLVFVFYILSYTLLCVPVLRISLEYVAARTRASGRRSINVAVFRARQVGVRDIVGLN